MRLRPCARARDSSSRRSHSIRSTISSGSVLTLRSPLSRRATMTIACASVASGFRPCPVSNTRARAASLAGTSRTRSPLASSRCVRGGRSRSRLPPPRSARATAARPGAAGGSCARRWRTGDGPQDLPVVPGFDRYRQLVRVNPDNHPVHRHASSPWGRSLCRRGRATLLRAEQTLLEPRLATAPGQDACHERATPISPGGQRQRERPAGHLTRACASPGQSWKT